MSPSLTTSRQLEMQIPTLVYVLKLAIFWQAADCNLPKPRACSSHVLFSSHLCDKRGVPKKLSLCCCFVEVYKCV